MAEGDRVLKPRLVRVEGGDDEEIRVSLFIDANTLGFGAALTVPFNLHTLIESLPSEASILKKWLPNIDLDSNAGFAFDPAAGSFSMFATAGTAGSAVPSAQVFVATLRVRPNPGTAYVVGIRLSSSIDLSGTPLFGSMLSGISLSNVAIAYASQDIPASAVVLPPPAPPQPAYKKGLSLSFTLSAGDSRQDFQLGSSSQNQTPPSEREPLAAEGADEAGDDAATLPPVQWFSLQKQLGPLFIGRIGVIGTEDHFGFAIDASLKLATLGVDLVGFSLAFPTSGISLGGLQVGLDGLSVNLSTGAVQLAGTLVKSTASGITEYNGNLLMQVGPYGIAAVGSFASLNGSPSFFVFGLIKGQFGGPPAFFVTGLAAGFGYNRSLKLPEPGEVQNFPLVLAATQGSSYLPDPSVGKALAKLAEGGWVPPSPGSYWVAAGIKFNSFQVIDAFVVLTVQFGRELVFAILGLAGIQLPKPGEGQPYIYAELALDAVLRPQEGTLQVTALLTPNSFVLDRNCRLTGGFAFYLWFGSNEHAGDFVITLGGYNPHFSPPAWYPSVPRLGFSWNISDKVHAGGGLYFAITPSCAMFGGSLEIKFQTGDLKAWFTAYADFIMWWKPEFFTADIGVSIGASYVLNIGFVQKTFSVELGADVILWGPPMRGVAHVKWSVISFTIDINGGGEPPPRPGTLADWNTFAAAFLPSPGVKNDSPRMAADDNNPNICRPRAASGLVKTFEIAGETVWIVSGEQFSVTTETVIPTTLLRINGPTGQSTVQFKGPKSGVYPVATPIISSIHGIAIYPVVNGQPSAMPLDLSKWTWTPTLGNVPESLWGLTNNGKAVLAANVLSALIGSTGVPNEPEPTGPPAIKLDDLKYSDDAGRPLPLPDLPPYDGSTDPPHVDTRQVVQDKVMDPAVISLRNGIVGVLNQVGVGLGLVGGDLSRLREEVYYTFQSQPMLGPLRTTGPRHPTTPLESAVAARPQRVAATNLGRAGGPSSPTLRAVFRQQPSLLQSIGRRAWQQIPLTRSAGLVFDDFTPRAHLVHAASAGFRAIGGGGSELALRPGSTLLWDLPVGQGLTLEGDGELPLRVTVFDPSRHYELVDDALLPAGASISYPLPTNAGQMAITGMAAGHTAEIAGWHGISRLLQLNPLNMLGQGVVVRPQSPLRAESRRRSRLMGVRTGRDIVGHNWTLGLVGITRGWIETVVPAPTRTFLVVLRREDRRSASEIPAIDIFSYYQSAGGKTTPPVRPQVRQLTFEGDSAHLFYDAPGGPAQGDRLHVVVTPGAGWRQEGLISYSVDPSTLLEGARARPLVPLAVSVPGTGKLQTKVVLR